MTKSYSSPLRLVIAIAMTVAWFSVSTPAGASIGNQAVEKSEKDDDAEQKSDDQDAKESENQKQTASEAGKPNSDSSDAANLTRRRRANPSSRGSVDFLNAFKSVVTKARRATVELKRGSRTVALGAIVDTDGYVLTKHSELRSPITCLLSDGREVSAQVYGIHQPTDLALLKIEATRLPTVKWSANAAPIVGSWLATVNQETIPLAVGVVGVGPRKIEQRAGFMGIRMDPQTYPDGVRIVAVEPGTPAEEAGIKVDDYLRKIDDQMIETDDQLRDVVGGFPPGTELDITVLRDGRELRLDITLGDRAELNPFFDRSNQQNSMGSKLSERRYDFPEVIQHDTALSNSQCGGPVVDLNGEVVGINIARAGRVDSYMLPASLVVPIIEDLKSGKFAPAVVNRDKIEEINRTLRELNNTINMAPTGDDALSKKLEELLKAEESANETLHEAIESLNLATQERLKVEIRLEEMKKRYREAIKQKEKLEKDLERLVTGVK